MRILCVREDFACGRDREGTPDALRALGLTVDVHRLTCDEAGAKIGSFDDEQIS